jgi:glycosyltransferase involved in cell wall biosynthesis
MKICMVSKHFPPYAGGVESRVYELSKWMASKGENVTVLTSSELGAEKSEHIDGVSVFRSAIFLTFSNAPFTPGILCKLFSLDYDIVDLNLPDPLNAFFVFLASLVRRKPYVVTYHSDIVGRGFLGFLFTPFEWLILSRASRIIATSPHYARQSKSLKCFLDKVEVAANFVDLRRFRTDIDCGDLRGGLLGGREKVVLFVGRLVPYKGLDVLIDSFEILKDRYRLVIVGVGPLENDLKKRSLKLGDSVFFAGEVSSDELPKYYCACDVLVLPSVTSQEAFGIVLLEAMACGKPVIASDFSGMPYVVGEDGKKDLGGFYEGEGGLLFPPKDLLRLSDAISFILSEKGYCERLGRRGLNRVKLLFTYDAVCSHLLRIYKSALYS